MLNITELVGMMEIEYIGNDKSKFSGTYIVHSGEMIYGKEKCPTRLKGALYIPEFSHSGRIQAIRLENLKRADWRLCKNQDFYLNHKKTKESQA